ncbi:enoyl-CoA hydratase/isomerase family protein [Actinomadura livida]|uniref:Enoyl-CoA hydratase/carnithine racemase n=1 Tax=Actinomadura livida TaxID=79909 RepID=A0A7W7ICY7_9ACTN|nr:MULTISPECIES: enoyl-CoA hydratase/isomerase family protein [Actinomadura]MBB4774721.1 enoyl-CoA hydratase/carnithine racemase [Actinomadura catellatispora]GGU06426.1 crotonase [Actinomadura livida]
MDESESGQGPSVLVTSEGHIGFITLNRPEKLNALSPDVFAGLEAAWRRFDADPAIRVVVFTGTGRGFCAGADMVAPSVTGRDRPERDGHVDMPKFTARHLGCHKPVITAVNGVCASAGLHFVVDSTVVIASDRATFLDTHANLGQVVALEPIGLARKMPLGAVLRMVALGRAERMSAQRAYELGMVSEVVPHENLADRARELAAMVAELSPTTLQRSLRVIWESLDLGLAEAEERGWRMVQDHYGHPDNVEGPRAFAEKRTPDWVDPPERV